MSRKFALVIGNTEYIDPGLMQLAAPGNDAEDFARVLRDHDLCSFDEVQVLINQLSSTATESIDEFFDQKKPDDLLVLYFSGHGVRDELGSLYLAFKNTVRSRLRATAVKSDYIREAMDQSRSKRQVVILDCCNSGAFPQGTKAEIGGPMGMASALQGYGRFVLMASDATQFAWEGDQVIGETRDSLFTHFLVKGLEGEADRDADGKITVDELYDYAYEQISKVTEKQTPTKAASKVEGEFILRQIMRLEDIKPVPLPADLMDEVEDTRPYVREAAVQKLLKILQGSNIGLARSAMAALEQIASDENTTRRVAQEAVQALEAFRQKYTATTQEIVLPPGIAKLDLEAEAPTQDKQTATPPTDAPPPTSKAQPQPPGSLLNDTIFMPRPPAGPVPPAAAQPSPAAPIAPPPVPLAQPGNSKPIWKRPLAWVIGGVGALAIACCAFWGLLSPLLSPSAPYPTNVPPAYTATAFVADTPTLVAAPNSPTEVPTLVSADQGTPTSVMPLTGSGPHVGSQDESLAAWNAGATSLWEEAIKQNGSLDTGGPGTVTYPVALAASQRVRWEWFWCATSATILESNLQNITPKFELDGVDFTPQLIDEDFRNGDWSCRTYFVSVSDWPAGTFHLTTTATITRQINDGSSDYSRGDYVFDYVVTVK